MLLVRVLCVKNRIFVGSHDPMEVKFPKLVYCGMDSIHPLVVDFKGLTLKSQRGKEMEPFHLHAKLLPP